MNTSKQKYQISHLIGKRRFLLFYYHFFAAILAAKYNKILMYSSEYDKIYMRGDIMTEIGNFIKSKREAANYTQKCLANACGLKHDSSIARIENGERNVSWDELGNISKVLKNFNVLEALAVAGFISQDEINPINKLHRLDELNDSELEDVQNYIYFLLYKKHMKDKEG